VLNTLLVSGARPCGAATPDRFAPLAIKMPSPTKTTRVNTAVTSFLYPLPTISPLSRAYGEWVACHVAFEDFGLGCPAGDCCPVRTRRVAGTSVQIAALSWQAHRHVGFTNDPSRATVRVQISDNAEAADFTVIDDVDTTEAGACESSTPPRLVAISRNPSPSDPVIYLSRDGPADYRIFVSSKSFSLLDAAALIVGARGERHRVEAALL
jgi:hypothetical protein